MENQISFTMIDNSVLNHPLMTDDLIGVYVRLGQFANNETRTCWPSLATLQERVGCSRSTLTKRLKRLERAGFIHIEKRRVSGQAYASNVYTLLEVGSPKNRPPSPNFTHAVVQKLDTNYTKRELDERTIYAPEKNAQAHTDTTQSQTPQKQEAKPVDERDTAPTGKEKKEKTQDGGGGQVGGLVDGQAATKKRKACGSKKPTVPRERLNAMIDAIVAAFRYDTDTLTGPEWSRIRGVAKQLALAGRTPEDVARIYRHCASRFTHFGVNALATNAADALRAKSAAAVSAAPPAPPAPAGPTMAELTADEREALIARTRQQKAATDER